MRGVRFGTRGILDHRLALDFGVEFGGTCLALLFQLELGCLISAVVLHPSAFFFPYLLVAGFSKPPSAQIDFQLDLLARQHCHGHPGVPLPLHEPIPHALLEPFETSSRRLELPCCRHRRLGIAEAPTESG